MTSVGLPDKLSGRFEKSFAYNTLRMRIPEILTRIIDSVHRQWPKFDQRRRECIGDIINKIAAIKYDLEHNRALTLICDGSPDCEMWNRILYEESEKINGKGPAYFDIAWLYSECFIYRKVAEAFNLSAAMRGFDWFLNQKMQSYYESLEASCSLAKLVCEMEECKSPSADTEKSFQSDNFVKLLKISLWGNRCDLSISAGVKNSESSHSVLDQLVSLDEHILLDHSNLVSSHLSQKSSEKKEVYVNIVLDNAGYELISDLVLCFYLLKTDASTRIKLHCKQFPWFVSDTTTYDLSWTLYQMTTSGDQYLSQIANTLNRELYSSYRLSISAEYFWTLPSTFDEMKSRDKSLFKELSLSDLVILKGDLNYRKLSQDRKWEPTFDFRPPNLPTSICTVRTLKSDTVFGLREKRVEYATSLDENWMFDGSFGIIHFIDAA